MYCVSSWPYSFGDFWLLSCVARCLCHSVGFKLKEIIIVVSYIFSESTISIEAPRSFSHLAKLKAISLAFWTSRHDATS